MLELTYPKRLVILSEFNHGIKQAQMTFKIVIFHGIIQHLAM